MREKHDILLPNKRRKALISAIFSVLLTAIVACIVLLASSYARLRAAIQLERIDYVCEISDQIITSLRFMETEYTDKVRSFANVIDENGIDSLDKLRNSLDTADCHGLLLASSDGGIIDLSGREMYISNRAFALSLHDSTDVVQSFTSLNFDEDYWMFADHITPLSYNGTAYDTIILAIAADKYRDNLAISLMDNRGATYVVSRNGSIEIKPQQAENVFWGYNIFASMERAGASEEDIAALTEIVALGLQTQQLMLMDGEEWLVSYEPISLDRGIIVTVPLAVTAAQTYDGLTDLVLLVALTMMLISAIAVLSIVVLFLRDRDRSRVVMAAEAKSDFFSKMSHDIRTPLNAIIGLQTLIKDSSDLETIQGYNDRSNTAAAYLLSILNDVLDMSRISSGRLTLEKEPFDMNRLIYDVSSLTTGMAMDKAIVFTTEVREAFETYYIGDTVRIKQTLVNLLNNAVKFTRSGGSIRLSASRRVLDANHDEVTMVVSDTGVGMSEDFLTRAFTPFEQERSSFTQQQSGSGLGLAIVHSLVTLMGGAITIDSSLDVGTVFTLTIPFERGKQLEQSPRETEDRHSVTFPGRRILLAEDNEVNQMVAASILKKKFDIDTEVAKDGSIAVRMFSAMPPGYYDLILMDVKMPVLDGLGATRAIRSLAREDAQKIPIIALSANAYAEDVELSIRTGMNGHLAKPIDVHALADALEGQLGRDSKDCDSLTPTPARAK